MVAGITIRISAPACAAKAHSPNSCDDALKWPAASTVLPAHAHCNWIARASRRHARFHLRANCSDADSRACQFGGAADKYFPNQSSDRRMMSSRSGSLAMWWPWLAYTTSVVGTPRVFSACQYSNDCGAGHSSSRSPTTISAGVFVRLMKLIAELFAYAAGSSYSDAPKNGIIHWSIWFWP